MFNHNLYVTANREFFNLMSLQKSSNPALCGKGFNKKQSAPSLEVIMLNLRSQPKEIFLIILILLTQTVSGEMIDAARLGSLATSSIII